MNKKSSVHGRFVLANRTGRIICIRNFLADQRGALTAEFAFLIVFIALVAATGFVLLGNSLTANFVGLSERVESAGTGMSNPFGGSGGGSGGTGGGGAGGDDPGVGAGDGDPGGAGNDGGDNDGGGNSGGGNSGGGKGGGKGGGNGGGKNK